MSATDTTFTKAAFDQLMTEVYKSGGNQPFVVHVAPKNAAMMEAGLKFQGRNWRRVKREMNKAWRRVRKIELSQPATDHTGLSLWRSNPPSPRGRNHE